MSCKIPVLLKDDKWKLHLNKLKEETYELEKEIDKRSKKSFNHEALASEALDVIQVCIGMLDKLEAEGLNVNSAIERHFMKLSKRGWKIKKEIEININQIK